MVFKIFLKKDKQKRQLLKKYILYIYVDTKHKILREPDLKPIKNLIFILTLLTTFTNTRGN